MKKRFFGKTIIILAAALVVSAALLFGYCMKLRNGDRVLPNVTVSGVAVGGMTRGEAESALQALSGEPEERFSAALPDGTSLSRSFSELGLSVSAADTASELLKLGRSGNLSDDLRGILSALLGRTEDIRAEAPGLKTEALASLAAEAARLSEREPTEARVFSDENGLSITLGFAGCAVDADALTEAFRAAILRGERSFTVSAEPIPAPAADLAGLLALIALEPTDAAFTEDGEVIPEKYGRTFDIGAAEAALAEAAEGETVEIPFETVMPERLAEEIRPLVFRDRLASYRSGLTDNETRTNNIRLAAASVDGTVLLPGELFSYNAALGERTPERGYGESSAYSFGRVVEEVGGGICQLSSELYLCCLLADEEIVERTNHAYYQGYVPYGFDATVSWGGPDFRFRNSGDYPLKLRAWVEDGSLVVELWGTKQSEGHIELKYEINQTLPAGIRYEESDELKPGQQQTADYGRDGMKVYTYRLYYDADGSLTETVQEAFNEYDARDRLILVGKEP